MFRTLLASLAVTAVVMVLVAMDRRPEVRPADAEAAALDWVGVGFAQEPRREIRGPLRSAAIDSALAATGSGEALSVERDRPGEIEVRIRTRDDVVVEVKLDDSLRVVELELEDPEDE